MTDTSLILTHCQDIARLRQLVNFLLDHLEEDMLQPEPPEASHCAFWWGNRESAVSVLTKLTQLMIKLVTLEQKLAAGLTVEEDDAITPDDEAIIERYVARLGKKTVIPETERESEVVWN